MLANLDPDLLLVPILLACFLGAFIGIRIVIINKFNLQKKQEESKFVSEVNDQSPRKKTHALAVVVNILFSLAMVAILLDFFLSVRSSVNFSNDLRRLDEYANECKNAEGQDLIFKCAGESLQSHQLANSWDARYPISGFRLLLHLPLILGVAFWTWWQLMSGKILEPKKTSGFWKLLFLGFGGYLMLVIVWFFVGNSGRANLYILLVLNTILLFAASAVGRNSVKSARRIK